MSARSRAEPFPHYPRKQYASSIDLKTEILNEWYNTAATFVIEFTGVFAIVLAVGLAIHQNNTPAFIGATYGSITAILYVLFKNHHFNPFLTLQAFLGDVSTDSSKMSRFMMFILMIVIWGVQILGSLAGAETLKYFFGNKDLVGSSIPTETLTDGRIVFLEFLGSFLLGSVIFKLSQLAATTESPSELERVRITLIQRVVMPITAGFALFVVTTLLYPTTGASINIIRSLGPAFVSGNYKGLGLQFAGQLIGYLGSCAFFIGLGMKALYAQKYTQV